MPMLVPGVAFDTSTGTNGVTLPKYHITSCFDHLDPTNVMVLLMMLSLHMMLTLAPVASHD